VLLVLVILGSVVTPELAIEMKRLYDSKYSSVLTGYTIVEVNGIEKYVMLSKFLENKDVQSLERILESKGYKPTLLDVKRYMFVLPNKSKLIFTYMPYATHD